MRLAVFPDPELNTLISYSYFGFQSTDLERLLKQVHYDSPDYFKLCEYKDRVDVEVQACFLGFLDAGSSTYLMYAYIYNGKEYGFAWETDDQEIISNSSHFADPPWYEFIRQGQSFKIKLHKVNPYLHYIIEKPFVLMNSTVLRLGPCRDAYPVNNDQENQYALK